MLHIFSIKGHVMIVFRIEISTKFTNPVYIKNGTQRLHG